MLLYGTIKDEDDDQLANTQLGQPVVTSVPLPHELLSSCGCQHAWPFGPRGWSLFHKHRNWMAFLPYVGTCGVSSLSCGWIVLDKLHICKVYLPHAWLNVPETKLNFRFYNILHYYNIFNLSVFIISKVVWINQIHAVIPPSCRPTKYFFFKSLKMVMAKLQKSKPFCRNCFRTSFKKYYSKFYYSIN